jgi:hypothetical protein
MRLSLQARPNNISACLNTAKAALILITWIHRFVTTDPITFRTGDIVEVQTTISVVPIKKDRFRMIVNLRALAMLDNGPSMVSMTTITDAEDSQYHIQ